MSSYKDSLQKITFEAGQLIMKIRNNYSETSKKDGNEILTPADLASNRYIVEQLKELYPEIEIYTEEETENKSQNSTRWIVDPLDGTTPWVFGNSGFSISIALEKESEIILGAVYDPVMKDFFYAEKGMGATCNGKPITSSKNIPADRMLIVVDWGNKDEKRKEGLEYFRHFFVPEMFARKIVPQWAPALGLCHIAEGRTHALICNDTWVEDHAAGSLILKESGGFCTNFYRTDSFNHRESGIIAANEELTHRNIVNFLSKH